MAKAMFWAGLLPILLAASMPARATVELASDAASVETPPAPFAEQPAYVSGAWIGEAHGKLVVMADNRLAAQSDGSSRIEPTFLSRQTASILVEPMAWVTMLAGVMAIGLATRSHLKSASISFV